MMLEEVYSVWTERRLTQEEAGQLRGICPRTFRRWAEQDHGLGALPEAELVQAVDMFAPDCLWRIGRR